VFPLKRCQISRSFDCRFAVMVFPVLADAISSQRRKHDNPAGKLLHRAARLPAEAYAVADAMTIEIHRPELEALLMEWMKAGAFENVEDVIVSGSRNCAGTRAEAPPPADPRSTLLTSSSKA
jgi:hypothetical protein